MIYRTEKPETTVNKYLEHFAMIRYSLGKNLEKMRSLGMWADSLAETRVCFEVMEADAHGFIPPVAMTLISTSSGNTSKKHIYKARPGSADCLVTELFGQINNEVKEEILPYYGQIVVNDGHLLSEFIDGNLVSHFTQDNAMGAGVAVDKLVPLSGEGVKIKAQLVRRLDTLDYVAKQIGLTDLHDENNIYNSEKNFVYPIDLESFAIGNVTGLFGEGSHESKLPDDLPKERIDKWIQSYKPQIEDTERRFVPVKTAKLKDSVDNKSVEAGRQNTRDLLYEALQQQFEINTGSLWDYVCLCVGTDNKLIPAFTLYRGKLFSSEIDGNKIVIATQKKKEEK